MANHAVAGIVVPSWLFRVIVGTSVTILLTGASALVVKVAQNHETRIAVIEEHGKYTDRTLEEIKEMQREQSRDTKEILKRLQR